jgi:hypothetical protein
MKRMFILLAIVVLSTGILFADEAVLIDFGKLVADIDTMPDDQDDNPNQNRATMMDFSNVAGSSFTEDQKSVMKTSLAIPNWDVVLASSSRTVSNQMLSYTSEATSAQFGTVMGVRVHFPVEPFQSWAIIRPPFDIPAFELAAEVDDQGNITASEDADISGPSRFEDGFGVVKNVGTIKAVAVNAYGLNFHHALSAILVNSEGVEQNAFMGYLRFDGWRELQWNNPQYVQEVRNRELRLYPLYPKSTPFVKFGGFMVQRDAAAEGGDFIAYFKDVKIIYDKAVLDDERDIDDEGLWNIIKEREAKKKAYELSQFGEAQVLRYLDGQKQATESSFTPSGDEEAAAE